MRKNAGYVAGWLHARRYALVLFFLCAGILLLVYGLYGYPWGVALYTLLLAAVAAGIFALFDAARYVARQKELERLTGFFPTGELPAPANSLEGAWAGIVRALEAEREQLAGQNERRQRDADEYYALWVHQVKTPLAAMRLLLGQEGAPPRKDISRRDRELELELFRVEQYVGMVLQYQRLTSMAGDLAFETHETRRLVTRAVKNCAPLFIGKNLPVEVGEIPGGIVTDEKWMVFVLEQLLLNAIKYTARGRVRVYGEGENVLVVEDTGRGIAPEDLPRVFERGFTGAVGRSERSSTGLGLYLCRRVLDRLGFGIEIESAPGVGTRVRIDLAQEALRQE